jgi:CRISPR-associated exonuclease Cas4
MTSQPVPFGYVWYGEPRRRLHVEFSSALRAQTVAAIEEVRAALRSGQLPPAVADQRCVDCQLEPQCLPDVVIRPADVLTYVDREVLACG